MAIMSGRQAIMEIFRTEGVQYIFGNPGTTELGFVDMLQDYPQLQYIMCPIRNPLYRQQTNPAADAKVRPDNAYADSPDERFPYVLTTYRLTEHHTAGGMSRMLPHLSELQPELFCELSPELAAERGIEPGGWVTVVTARGRIVARALVTPRIQPLRINGRVLHQVGLPYHWGYSGLVKGDVVNDLIAISEEPNVRIMETKGILCNVLPGRLLECKGAFEQGSAQAEGRV